jgi:phage I-like protein
MEIGTISLLVSLAVGGSQIWKFIEERHSKKEDKLAVFARKTDVENDFRKAKLAKEELATSITHLQEKLTSYAEVSEVSALAANVVVMGTKQAVLEERVNHSIDGLEKIEVKLDKIIERL